MTLNSPAGKPLVDTSSESFTCQLDAHVEREMRLSLFDGTLRSPASTIRGVGTRLGATATRA